MIIQVISKERVTKLDSLTELFSRCPHCGISAATSVCTFCKLEKPAHIKVVDRVALYRQAA